ncbi:MAG TPA: galactose oxidase [Vitreimonas sp.]|uniref:Kelch repeat-containing protein n=1 Tax=Vitreimonas sp. TaxID=3069702 RepID=UPI002D6E7338|nr:galactose oxidase [Vitreimonas sp.]HYD88492.1 galactose oxidase [Vitreimonas sp.]
MPYAVQEIYPALHDGAIWIAGGFSPQALGATKRVIVFDLAANAWREGPDLPEPSHHVHLASLDGALYAIGGFRGGLTRMQWICVPRVLRLDRERWVEAPALPKPIGEAVPLVHEGRIHLIGGRSPAGEANSDWNHQADVADHFVLAAGAGAWERAAPLPLARNSAAGAVLNGALHVISGRTVAGGQTPAHDIYDPQTDTWRDGAPYPEPRGGLAAATLGNAIIAGGGEIFEPSSVGTALYRFDTSGDWQRFETLPTPRHGHGFMAVNDALYALGGAQRVGGNGTLASVDVLTSA